MFTSTEFVYISMQSTVCLLFTEFVYIFVYRCSAGSGGTQIQVTFKPAFAQKTGENILDVTYTMMISPNLPQPRIYDLCGQTHDLVFDLSILRTNELINDILTIPALGDCPQLRALGKKYMQ